MRRTAKRAAALILVCAALALCQTALATGLDSASELMTLWGSEGYPDDVGGVFYERATGKCCVLLTTDDDARKNEILAIVNNDENVEFISAIYSFNFLNAVSEEIINEYLSTGAEIYSCGVGFSAADGMTGYGESGREFRVVVEVMPEYYDKYVKLFLDTYGDAVKAERFGGYAANGETPTAMREYTGGELWFYGIFIGLSVVFIILIIIWQKKKKSSE